jgi:hypothetical protein
MAGRVTLQKWDGMTGMIAGPDIDPAETLGFLRILPRLCCAHPTKTIDLDVFRAANE